MMVSTTTRNPPTSNLNLTQLVQTPHIQGLERTQYRL
jgi:hypothetical protein